jgi:hypothetical protein
MTVAQMNTPDCRNFEARLEALASDFFARHSMTPLGEVRYFGVDPKGAGRLFLAFFRGEGFLLKIRTVDGAADVLIGPASARLEWQDDGWLWPAQVAQMAVKEAPEMDELVSLRNKLKNVGWA